MASPYDCPSPSLGDMPTRPMRVKVLYTFDAESKTTCLARLSDTLQIPVVEIEQDASVGVIPLQRCLQSIILASPELLPPLHNQDYAIYAYDYSEHETPLVGQGMLSTAITQSGSSANTMVTGRVCQNIPAIFSNGVKETLEVKLRLTPVKQPKDQNGTGSPRHGSFATSAGFDPNAWNNAMPPGRSPQDESELLHLDLMKSHSASERSVLDEMFGTDESINATHALKHMGSTNSLTDSGLGESPAFSAPFHSAPGSRAGSPMSSGGVLSHMRHNSFSAGNAYPIDQPRCESRASMRGDYNNVQESSYDECLDDDGQPRKRAKITQTDWRGRSSFGGKSGNLRVTAATTASMQLYRPVPARPSAIGHDLEPPPRVPTPVPKVNNGPRRLVRPSLGPRSLLRQSSTMSSYTMSDIDALSDAIASSPEDNSPGNSIGDGVTPPDIPSSPPVFSGAHIRSPGRASSNWQQADSGYMSERNKPDESCSPEFDTTDTIIKKEGSAVRYIADAFPFDLNSDLGFEADLPQQDAFGFQSHRAQPTSRAQSPAINSRRGSLALPTLAPAGAQHAGVKKRQSSQQPRAFCHDSEAGSPAPSEVDGRPSGPRRSGSGAQRRKVIQDRCLTAVSKGEMPPFCNHCGAIETPTWRRLYVKVIDGKPSPLDEVEGEGEVVGVEQTEWDDHGECTKFIVRKSMKKTRDSQPGKGFSDIQLCNPCGLWFSKTRKMRPQDRWGRRSGTRKSKKTRATGEMSDTFELQSEAFFTDNLMPDDGFDGLDFAGNEQRSNDGYDRSRSRSISGEELRQPDDDARWRRADNTRTGQSSPGEVNGTADSPIELDDKTPRPTRRLLFPSPRQEGETKTLDDAGFNLLHSRTQSGSVGKDAAKPADTNFAVFKITSTDKENVAPDLSDLSRLFKTPQKTPLRRSPRSIAKTQQDNVPSSPTPGSRKRKALAENSSAANAGKPVAHDFMTSPASSRYFLRSTPTRLANSPGRSASKGSQDVSPFSRQLAEMLTHDTSFNSPGAFADFPAFASPSGQHVDWENLEALMSSDFSAQPEK